MNIGPISIYKYIWRVVDSGMSSMQTCPFVMAGESQQASKQAPSWNLNAPLYLEWQKCIFAEKKWSFIY